jgi:hypothetical protein
LQSKVDDVSVWFDLNVENKEKGRKYLNELYREQQKVDEKKRLEGKIFSLRNTLMLQVSGNGVVGDIRSGEYSIEVIKGSGLISSSIYKADYKSDGGEYDGEYVDKGDIITKHLTDRGALHLQAMHDDQGERILIVRLVRVGD